MDHYIVQVHHYKVTYEASKDLLGAHWCILQPISHNVELIDGTRGYDKGCGRFCTFCQWYLPVPIFEIQFCEPPGSSKSANHLR